DADPGIGFAARITAGAQRRLVVRRRQRIVAGTAGAVVAAAAIAVIVMREPTPAPVAVTPEEHRERPATEPQKKHHPWHKGEVDADVRALVPLANVERSSHLSARWARIEKPLAPYRAVLKEKQP